MTARPPVRIAVFDYGAGNMHSLIKALARTAAAVRVEVDPARAADPSTTDLLVLPGVGAFDAAAARLAPGRDAMRAALGEGLPCLGICLGMQLLLDGSDEGVDDLAGLGIIAGRVRRLRAERIPQIGWNAIQSGSSPPRAGAASTAGPAARTGTPTSATADVRTLTTAPEDVGTSTIATPDAGTLTTAYYANSYVCDPEDPSVVRAWSEHESDRFPAIVAAGVRDSVIGVQFHPEKSSTAGVAFLHRIVRRADEERAR